ncbi:MAG: OadG family protein [Lachnospiraceae bacterium]|nr:OadG family protein [Lachnospiraceae bacterium]
MVGQALMNTVMGISIVFCMLALISILIYCFRIVPYLTEKFSKKESPDPKPEQYMDIRLLVPEPTEDERELVAVIAAAIAASEQISTDDFVVRSIRRRY